jgi:glycosyltransferase involved in cell wall biosynthesis
MPDSIPWSEFASFPVSQPAVRVLVSLEARFARTPDGAVWASANFGYRFWQRYLDVFSEVFVLARVADVRHVPDRAARVDGDRVRVTPIPSYIGPRQFLLQHRRIRAVIRSAVGQADAAIIRVPSLIGTLAARELVTHAKPFGVEVVGDPFDVFASGAMRHPLRRLFRWRSVTRLQRTVRAANAAAYVSPLTLPARYPARDDAFVTYYSSIELRPDAIVRSPRVSPTAPLARVALVTVGSLEQRYKGTDTLIDAVAMCRSYGLDVRLTIVGDGRLRGVFEQHAVRHGVSDVVHFAGHLPAGSAVRAELDRADLFVLPSRTEGLPRAMIEAMARGLPCIGTRIGGIPELIPDAVLVPPGDAVALAKKIDWVVRTPGLLSQLSTDNLRKVAEYGADVLRVRRQQLYDVVAKQAIREERS